MKSMLTTLLLVEVWLLGTSEVSAAEGLFETKDIFEWFRYLRNSDSK